MMELNADFLSRLINQIRQQGAVAITLGSGTRLIATWKQDATAMPTIEVKIVPPQPSASSESEEDILRPRVLCPQCRGDGIVIDPTSPIGLKVPCARCYGNGWVFAYQE